MYTPASIFFLSETQAERDQVQSPLLVARAALDKLERETLFGAIG
jgi:hypothetical protein